MINVARRCLAVSLAVVMLLSASALVPTLAQSRRQPPTSQEKKNKRPESIARPGGQQPQPGEEQNVEKSDEVLEVATNIVNVDAVVYHKKTGQIVPNLTRENFAIFEENQQKEVANFSTPEAPITVVLVVEYSKLSEALGRAVGGYFEPGKFEVVRPAALFLTQFIRPPDDYASLIAFDIRPTPITDFTNDPKRIGDAVNILVRNNPAFSENNVFDAVKFALVGGRGDSVVLDKSKERTTDYAGLVDVQARRKAVILITSGIDTFSKVNYDETRRIIQKSGVPLYIIGTGNMFYKRYEHLLPATDGITGSPGRLTFLQAQNTLNTFAKESGGSHQPITFESEVPNALQNINALLRNQYSLAYDAGSERQDGRKRKLLVKVDVNKDGQYDDKEYVVQHRPFYIPPGGLTKEEKKKREKEDKNKDQ